MPSAVDLLLALCTQRGWVCASAVPGTLNPGFTLLTVGTPVGILTLRVLHAPPRPLQAAVSGNCVLGVSRVLKGIGVANTDPTHVALFVAEVMGVTDFIARQMAERALGGA